MDTGDRILISVKANTRPGKLRFYDVRDSRGRPRNLDYSLRIGISDEDAMKRHVTWGGGEGLTVVEAVKMLRDDYGFDLFLPLRKNRDKILAFVRTTVFDAYGETYRLSPMIRRELRGRGNLIGRGYSNRIRKGTADEAYYTTRGTDIRNARPQDTIKRRLEEYGKYWVDIIKSHILGYNGQLSPETINVRERKKSTNAEFTYKAGIRQPAVETGLIWDSISYEVKELSGSEEIDEIHERWKREGRWVSPDSYASARKTAMDTDIDALDADTVVSYSWNDDEKPTNSIVKKVLKEAESQYRNKTIYSNQFKDFKETLIGIARHILVEKRMRDTNDRMARMYATQALFSVSNHSSILLTTGVIKTEYRGQYGQNFR